MISVLWPSTCCFAARCGAPSSALTQAVISGKSAKNSGNLRSLENFVLHCLNNFDAFFVVCAMKTGNLIGVATSA